MPFIDAVSFAESNNPDTSYEGREGERGGGGGIYCLSDEYCFRFVAALELVKHSI